MKAYILERVLSRTDFFRFEYLKSNNHGSNNFGTGSWIQYQEVGFYSRIFISNIKKLQVFKSF